MMKRIVLYISIAVLPFLFVIVVNESTKVEPHRVMLELPGKPVVYTLNTDKMLLNTCTWDCHNIHCSHADSNKINKGRVKLIYNFIIDTNGVHEKQEGKYIHLTLLTLVVIWPLLMFALIIGNIELYLKRKKARHAH